MSEQFSEFDHTMMERALEQARAAMCAGEVPVGAVVVHAGEILATGQNRVIRENDPSAHAEIVALRAAGCVLDNYRLPGCDLFVSLEPCCMCAGAIIHARISRVVFAATDPKTGAAGGRFSLLTDSRHNHCVRVEQGLCAAASGEILRKFFTNRRGAQRMV